MVIQLCNGHFLSDRSEGRSAASHAVIKLGFAAEERFLGRILFNTSYTGTPGQGLLAACYLVVPVSVFSLCSANWGCGGHSCRDRFA